MSRALVTGAAGFVGANLVRRLAALGHEVHAVVRPRARPPWRLRALPGNIRVHEVDLTEAEAIDGLVRGVDADWVFHLAAHGAYASQTDVREMVATNLLGTMNLLEAARRHGFEAFVHAGSSSEYGFQDHPPSEEERPEPNSHYAVTKLAATQYCRFVARREGLRVATLRLYSVFGPFEDPGRLVPRLITEGRNGRWPPLVSGEIARDFVYVDDVLEAFLLAARGPGLEPGAVFNVGSGRQTTLREAAEVAGRVLPMTGPPAFGAMPPRAWDTEVWVADVRKAARDLGWTARTSFEEGLQHTVRWLDSRPDLDDVYRAGSG